MDRRIKTILERWNKYLGEELILFRNIQKLTGHNVNHQSHNDQNRFIKNSHRDNEYECFFSYMNLKGWELLARRYKAGHEIKFKSKFLKKCNILNPDDDREVERVLRRVGTFRIYTIQKLFDNAKKNIANTIKDQRERKLMLKSSGMIIAGSTNITSDYDITINGTHSSSIVENMFQTFYNIFNVTLPFAFDSNLYISSASIPSAIGTRIRPDGQKFLSLKMNCKKKLHKSNIAH